MWGMTATYSTIGVLMARNSFLTLSKRSGFCNAFSIRQTRTFSQTTSSIMDDSKLVQDMLYRIRAVNKVPDEVRPSLLDFQVDGIILGKAMPETAKMLCNVDTGTKPIFQIQDGLLKLSSEAGDTVDSRTQAVAKVTEKLRDDGVVKGWRDEMYPISDSFYNKPIFLMERAAVSLLGVLEYGVHINGIVREHPSDAPKMWMGRRSKTKSKFPGMLDHIAAGGQAAGLGLLDNVVKECQEEAGIPMDMAREGVHAAGAVSYESFSNNKLTRCVLYNFDLYLPKDFQPVPVDGEAEEFLLWSIDEVKASMAPDFADPIKPNCYIVIIDYLIRTGQVSPEAPGYLDVLRELRSGDCR